MLFDILQLILIVSALLAANALYVAGEFAAVSARRSRIVQKAEAGNRLARTLLPYISDPHKLDGYIAASQVGITISSIVLGIYGQQQIAPRLSPFFENVPLISGPSAAAGLSATVVLLLLTTLQVVLGELVPKSIAIQYPERTAMYTVLPMSWSAEIFLRPLIHLLNGSGTLLLRLAGREGGGEHQHVHSPEEIEILVRESHKAGLLDSDERQLLHNAFRIGELTAGDVMVPRTRLVTAPLDSTIREALALAATSAYTRIPVYEEDVDHIVGFVHLRDLFQQFQVTPESDLRTVLREATFVPETSPVTDVWEQLNTTRSYLAVVFDEYGGTAGIITQEDLIEELFGELQDEFDQEAALVTPGRDGRVVIRGDVPVTQVNELLDLSLPTAGANSVGGVVLDALGRAPVAGDVVEIGGVALRIESVAGRSVREISLVRRRGEE